MGEGGVRLVNHNLDEIFNDGPVRLPQTMTARQVLEQVLDGQVIVYREMAKLILKWDSEIQVSSGLLYLHLFSIIHRRQFSPPSAQSPISAPAAQHRQPLSEMPEAYEALDVVLAQVMNQDPTTCIGALRQLDELIKDKEKVQLMAQRMDQLLSGCFMAYRHVLKNTMKTDNCDPAEVMRVFQYLTMVLMSMYHNGDITRTASTSAVHDLVHIIICVLLEPDVAGYPQGAQLIRALNVLTVKIVDRSDHTNITSAFLRLLKESVGNPTLAPKYTELVMKCLWKVIRSLPNGWMEDLNVDLILSDLHAFLKEYPTSYWKAQESDTPVRTVKTVVHSLTKLMGDAVLDHLGSIRDPENSELVPYLKKLLSNGIGKENTENNGQLQPGDPNNMQSSNRAFAAKKAIPRFSKSDHETLAEIFKKIGQKEQTKQVTKTDVN